MPMMGDESKKAALIIIGKKPKLEDEGSESSGEEGLDVAAEEVLKAVQGGSALALKSALKNFVEICGSSYEGGESDQE